MAVWCALAAYMVNAMLLEMRYFEFVNVLAFALAGGVLGLEDRLGRRGRERGSLATVVPCQAVRPGE
ncbi:MAG: hypothetical protein QF819_02045 [Gemmatimonadota bacterium]|nr:hypothetical protein [Gemmatimonadota bacterium]MDP6801944.1 hypothetical protein [Gemmatimonadota bacterium]MDP7032365.1 hypothetical protein [Gemmatimonadota bacterium]